MELDGGRASQGKTLPFFSIMPVAVGLCHCWESVSVAFLLQESAKGLLLGM